MRVDLTQEIKNRLTMRDVAELYGYVPNSAGFICCPFHNEKTPSMKLYAGDRGYYCFGCGEHGDVITFVRKLFDLEFNPAIQKLNDDFGLGLSFGSARKSERIEMARRAYAAKREREKKRKELEEIVSEYDRALYEYARLDNNMRQYAPKGIDEELHPLFVEAVSNIKEAEMRLSCAETRLYLYEHKLNASD